MTVTKHKNGTAIKKKEKLQSSTNSKNEREFIKLNIKIKAGIQRLLIKWAKGIQILGVAEFYIFPSISAGTERCRRLHPNRPICCQKAGAKMIAPDMMRAHTQVMPDSSYFVNNI